MESKEPAAADPQVVDSSVRALLVKKNGGEGAVRVDDGTYVRTGKNQGDGFVIVTVKTGRICVLLGHPSVRYFKS